MTNCSRCGVAITEPNLEEAIKREDNFRRYFENTWNDEEGRLLVCNKCFDEMDADTDAFERSQL